MTSTKPWYASAGVWGALVTLAGSVATLLKVEFDPGLLDDVAQWLVSVATLVGGAVALWGRLRAVRRIGPGDAPGGAPGPGGADRPARLPPPSDGGPASRRAPARPAARALGRGLAAAALLLAAGGCSAPADAYRAADRATYDAVAPEYRAYVAGDPALSEEQRDRRRRTLDVWRVRIDRAERDADPDDAETATDF